MVKKTNAATLSTLAESIDILLNATTRLCAQAGAVWDAVATLGFPEQYLEGRSVFRKRAGMSALKPAAWRAADLAEVKRLKVDLAHWWRALADSEIVFQAMTAAAFEIVVDRDVKARFRKAVSSIRAELQCPRTEWCNDDFQFWFVEWAVAASVESHANGRWLSRQRNELKLLHNDVDHAATSVGHQIVIHGLTHQIIDDAIATVPKAGKCLETELMKEQLRLRLGLRSNDALLCLRVLRILGYFTPPSGRAARGQVHDRANEVIDRLQLKSSKYKT